TERRGCLGGGARLRALGSLLADDLRAYLGIDRGSTPCGDRRGETPDGDPRRFRDAGGAWRGRTPRRCRVAFLLCPRGVLPRDLRVLRTQPEEQGPRARHAGTRPVAVSRARHLIASPPTSRSSRPPISSTRAGVIPAEPNVRAAGQYGMHQLHGHGSLISRASARTPAVN